MAPSQHAWARAHLEAERSGYGVTDDMSVRAFDLVLLSNLASVLMSVGGEDGERLADRADGVVGAGAGGRWVGDPEAPGIR